MRSRVNPYTLWLAGLLAAICSVSCSSHKFGGESSTSRKGSGADGSKDKNSKDKNTNVGGTPKGGGDSVNQSDSEVDAASLSTEEGIALARQCPKTPQNIIIFDMKSGWWSGDGGDFFHSLLTKLKNECQSISSIEYHHLLQKKNMVSFFTATSTGAVAATQTTKLYESPSLAAYTQVWLLSGSENDNEDIRTNHPNFVKLISDVKASSMPLFIGTGNGNMTHANATLQALGMKSVFATTNGTGGVVPFRSNAAVSSILNVDEHSHPLFVDIKSIAGDVTIQIGISHGTPIERRVYGDFINDSSDFLSVGRENSKTVLAVSSKQGGRRIVLDSGLQRYYAVQSATPTDTMTLIVNIAKWLSR